MDIRQIDPRRTTCFLCGAPLPKGRKKYCFKCRPSRARSIAASPGPPGNSQSVQRRE